MISVEGTLLSGEQKNDRVSRWRANATSLLAPILCMKVTPPIDLTDDKSAHSTVLLRNSANWRSDGASW
jgi:hypothetical protein